MSAYSRSVIAESISSEDVLNGSGTSSDFQIRYEPPLILGGRASTDRGADELLQEWEVALISFKCFNSVPNVDPVAYNNARFTYIFGGTPYNVDLVKGNYAVADIEAQIQADLIANGFPSTSIKLAVDYAAGKIIIQLAAGFTWDLTTSNLYLLFGFDLSQSPVSGIDEGLNVADMTNGITGFTLHCSAVASSYINGATSDVIGSYQPTTKPNTPFELRPSVPIYMRCRSNDQFGAIRFYVRDSQGRTVDYNSSTTANHTTWEIHFRRVPRRMY